MITPQLPLELPLQPLAQREGAKAGFKNNGAFGFKPLITYADGTTSFPISMHCRSPEAARAVAQAFIDAGRA
jgi:hypothetical protein